MSWQKRRASLRVTGPEQSPVSSDSDSPQTSVDPKASALCQPRSSQRLAEHSTAYTVGTGVGSGVLGLGVGAKEGRCVQDGPNTSAQHRTDAAPAPVAALSMHARVAAFPPRPSP